MTAMDLGPAGPDNDFGNGRLDVLAAYQFLQSGGSAPTPTPMPTNTPTSTPAPAEPTPTLTSTTIVHMGDLDGWANPGSRNRWETSVSITVHDSNELSISGASVSGTWSGGVSGNDICVTDSNGQCVVIKGNIKNNVGSVSYSVADVSVTSFQYQSNANHDPDGDSDGTIITISRP